MKIYTMKIGDTLDFVVKRNGEEITVQCKVLPRAIKHHFTLKENPTPEQLALRKAWSQNFMN